MCRVHTKILKCGTDLDLCLGYIEVKVIMTVFINNENNDNKQCLLDTVRTVMVNKENCYGEYKSHTKWLSLISSHFAKNTFFFFFFSMTLLHAYTHYICSKVPESFIKSFDTS